MAEPKGAIPELIIFIFGLILGSLLAIPSQVDISVMILEAIARGMQPSNVEQANQMVGTYIKFFRIFGIVLIAVDALGIIYLVIIYIQLK
jgi:hypothetical protein